MLNRFLTFKNKEKKKPKERHMFLALECHDLTKANKWRQYIIERLDERSWRFNPSLNEHHL
jgi:pre-mRNA-splicing factor ISY1